MDRDIREITIIRAGALGDVVLALPAVSALRAAFPAAQIRAVGYPLHWAVAGDLIDEALSIDAAAMAGVLSDSPGEPLQRALGSSDLVVAWTSRDPTAALRGIGVQRIAHSPPTPPPGTHTARWLLQSLDEILGEEMGSGFDLESWRLPYSRSELQTGRKRLEELGLTGAVLIHPGAGATWKRWPAARFAATAATLVRLGRRVALIAGPADGSTLVEVQRHMAQPLPVLPPLPVRALGAILAQAPCYLGNDSGVTHLAGASGAPTVALFGPTDPALWSPLGNTTVIRHCTALSRAGAGIRVCDDPTCLEAVSVDEVIQTVERVIVQNRVENCR